VTVQAPSPDPDVRPAILALIGLRIVWLRLVASYLRSHG